MSNQNTTSAPVTTASLPVNGCVITVKEVTTSQGDDKFLHEVYLVDGTLATVWADKAQRKVEDDVYVIKTTQTRDGQADWVENHFVPNAIAEKVLQANG